jgi:hypothetical protein
MKRAYQKKVRFSRLFLQKFLGGMVALNKCFLLSEFRPETSHGESSFPA